MKFEKTEVWGFEHAIRGMRNPWESWGKSDSYYGNNEIGLESYVIGKNDLEYLRQKYNETKDKRYWKELIRLLPESWLQKRTITMSYELILNMYRQRKNHKLTEWSKSFCDWVKTLPYAEELICLE